MTYLFSAPLLEGDLFGLGRAGARSASVDRTLAGVRLGPVGKCPHRPILFITSIDNSGSVAGGGGNDPCGNRFQEIRFAIAPIAQRCTCGKELVALLNFDSPNSGDVAPTPIRGGMPRIDRGLAIPPDGGGSSVLGPSLAQARRIAIEHPDHDTVFVVLSDFELLDPDFGRVLEELSDFPGQAHAVVLRSAPPQQLVDDPRVIVNTVNSADPPGTLAKAIFCSLIATRRFTSRGKKT